MLCPLLVPCNMVSAYGILRLVFSAQLLPIGFHLILLHVVVTQGFHQHDLNTQIKLQCCHYEMDV